MYEKRSIARPLLLMLAYLLRSTCSFSMKNHYLLGFKTNAYNSELTITAAIGCFATSIHSYTGACGIDRLICCGATSCIDSK